MRATSFLSIAFIAAVAQGAVIRDASATCTKPAQRKEWRTLTRKEQTSFIDAIKCLSNLPRGTSLAPRGDTPDIPAFNNASSYYDDFVYAHMDSNIKDHFTGIFLPWHRWFLHTFLEALQDQCGYDGVFPYWNWTLDVKNVTASPLFNPNKQYGLGSFGTTEADNYTVHDGALNGIVRAYPTPHSIARHFDLYPFKQQVFPFEFPIPDMPATDAFTPEAIKSIVNGSKGNYTDFAYKIDGVRAQGPHNAAHLMMGGDLSSLLWSPNDPIFFLHHAMLDCTWEKWQNRRSENMWAIGGGLTQDVANFDTYPVGAPPAAKMSSELPTVGLTPPVTVLEMMSTKNANLCYQCVW
ncbi:Tyrosinase tyrosinase: common central domain containing protein [Ceratobasidium theobromae]|uniref:Tyrosinase tyrosinase: common central domain containing protein n=1 Tax=Ceratobasidium theobromae TaxID=1582974 RepID=A0A5N5QF97_9AGAM|nr:Tyrosinase tyrosinase: common central domain containing protein [Ceratobasidium theobromae]